MKSLFKILILPLATFLTLSLPFVVYAQTTNQNSAGVTNQSSSGITNQISNTPTLKNPLKYASIQAIVSALLTAVEYVGGIACALYIIWAGFLFVKARGNETELEEAKKTITHALIGTAIILGASVILTVVTNTINAIKS